MNIPINLIYERFKRKVRQLLILQTLEFEQQKPTDKFKALLVFKGWEHVVSCWFMKRLDHEVDKHNDFVEISDLKYKLNDRLCVNYVSKNGIDYDDFIEMLASKEGKNSPSYIEHG